MPNKSIFLTVRQNCPKAEIRWSFNYIFSTKLVTKTRIDRRIDNLTNISLLALPEVVKTFDAVIETKSRQIDKLFFH